MLCLDGASISSPIKEGGNFLQHQGDVFIYKGSLLNVGWLVDLILNVSVNNFSVMLGRSHRFLGITSTFGR